MKPEAQRIAIAEACGWKFSKIKGEFRYVSIPPDGVAVANRNFGDVSNLPDYLNDLNACHEAEKVLNLAQFWAYADWLKEARHKRGLGVDEYITATAALRSESLLRALHLWTP
jgi:hypothetical protein